MKGRIAVAAGDGIGPEVMREARAVLDAIAARFGHSFEYVDIDAGGAALDKYGIPLPAEALETARACDALLLSAVGGPRWDTLPGRLRPEQALLGLRAGLGAYANLRPARLMPPLRAACPLKDEVLCASNPQGTPAFDILFVRELTGGIYFGERGREGNRAFDTESYTWDEIERILRVGFEAAKARSKKVTVVDKANILESSRLWREAAEAVAKDFPDINLDFLYVDNAAMQLVRAPGRFDVVVTSNLFGDILSDEAAALTGSIGMLPSASLGAGAGMYEPVHGSAPDIAGQDAANPLGMILSAAMLLRHSFHLEREARAVEDAAAAVLEAGFRTPDLCRGAPGERPVGTRAMGAAVREAL
ncbi:MAG: 3-isopropylmalate dehydrogenase [Treponema sp.]|jgi:3-isopropylmalate dehydrogenase|nr:3-isopropylmalate dehydrogenase [Treponema sp.]